MTVPISDRLSQLYVGNGTNTRFDFTFRIFQQEDATGVAVRKKGTTDFETVDPNSYTVTLNPDEMGGYITFNAAPATGTFFYIAGATSLDQLLDITNYDNFYPDAIERALDKLTALLQERSTEIDLEKQARILADIQYDALAMERESDLENRLISYINAMIGITNPAIFDGVSDRMIITQDGRTQRELNASLPFWTGDYVDFKQATYLREEQILQHTNSQITQVNDALTEDISAESTRALAAEQALLALSNANGVGNRAYKTYAEMDADKANIPPKSKVTVTSDSDTTKRGDWQWDGTVFTKSPYDPLLKPDLPIETKVNLYKGSNTTGYYVRPADGFIISAATNAITVIAVEAGKTYALTASDLRTEYLVLSYSATSSVSGGKQNALAVLNSTSNPNIKTFTVPTGMKFVFINVLWPNFSFDIRASLVVQPGNTIEYAIKTARGLPIIDTLAQSRLDTLDANGPLTKADVLPSDNGPAIALTTFNDFNVNPSTGGLRVSTGCKIARFNIIAGKRYKIKAPDLRPAYVVVSVSESTSVTSGKGQVLVPLIEVDATTKIFTAPENMISACINTVWPNFALDISATLVVEELAMVAVTQISGVPVRDEVAQAKIKSLEEGGAGGGYVSNLKDKSVVYIGDSITDPTNDWATTRYFDFIANAVGGMIIQNLGVSGSGFGNRTTAASYITLTNPDYIIPFMGTNDFGVLNQERNAEGKPYPMGTFLSSTNLTVSGAINLTLTNIFAAFPLAKVAIITPLPRGTRAGGSSNPSPNFGENPPPNRDGVSLEAIANELIRYAKHYSLPVLDLYHHSNFLASSEAFQTACMTDGVHPNNAGHLILGQKILKFMESI